MKNMSLSIAVVCAGLFGPVTLPAIADAPQACIFQIAPSSSTISLGEPFVLKLKVTNVEDRRIAVNVDDDQRGWLKMTLIDSSGNPVQAVPDTRPTPHHPAAGIEIDSNSQYTDYVIASQKFQPTVPGRYRLRLFTNLVTSTDNGQTVSAQTFSLPLTITAKDPKRLHATAENLKQTVLHGSEYRWAVKALFSMRDPDCLPVWRELTTEPTLDAFRATEVINELVKVGSPSASNILAEMQPIAPERWRRTGLDPLNALEDMRRTAGPELTQHINELLVAAGVDLNHVPYGSVN